MDFRKANTETYKKYNVYPCEIEKAAVAQIYIFAYKPFFIYE